MSGKSATLYARIDPSVKTEAENILASLNMTASGAINLFYKQIILHKGLPFEIKLPSAGLCDMDALNDKELYNEVMKGVQDARKGRTVNAEAFFDALAREFRV